VFSLKETEFVPRTQTDDGCFITIWMFTVFHLSVEQIILLFKNILAHSSREMGSYVLWLVGRYVIC